MAPLAKPEWFRVFAADFLSDVAVDAMSTLELGAAFRLLCRQWIDGDLPDDGDMLARLARLEGHPEWAKAWAVLDKFFPITSAGRRANRYMAVEREKVLAEMEHRREEGARSARKRWDKHGSPASSPNGSPMGHHMQEQSRVRAEQSKRGAEVSPPPEPRSEPGPGSRNEEAEKQKASLLNTSDEQPTPEDLPTPALARGLIEKLGLPVTTNLMRTAQAAIEAKARHNGLSFAEAHDFIRDRALQAAERGEHIENFWFADARYDLTPKLSQSDRNQRWLETFEAKQKAGGP